MTEVGNLRLAGADERAPILARGWDPRVRILERLLDSLRFGSLSVTLPTGRTLVRVGPEPGPEANAVLHRWRAVHRIFAGGDIGLAQAWIDGDWSSTDLTGLLRLAARNLHALGGAQKGSSVSRLAFRLRHLLNANTRRGSARNIIAHYDLGNDFFRLWLDDAMLYSSALWDGSTPTLEAAQSRKVERIRDLLQIRGGERILEIGSGWGALAVRLAEAGAARVTGLTLSPAQLDFAGNLAVARGAAAQLEFRLEDYRDVDGLYDRVVSIEMIEAVGEAWWPIYFGKIARSMQPGGRAVLQAITIAEEHFDDYRRTVDFIQRYIFPGGCLPSKTVLHQQFERAGLRLVSEESFGLSYARTLAEWRRRFHARWPDIAALGFDDRFRRLWDYYLSYCAAGFLEGVTDVGLYCVEHAREPMTSGSIKVDR